MDAPELNERNAMHLCACKIVVGGDPGTVVARGAVSQPIPWPDILVLQSLHGEDAIYDIKPVGLALRQTPFNEKQRMASIYGYEPVDAVYAGRSPNMEWFAPGWPVDPTGTGVNKREAERSKAPKVKLFAPEDVEEAV